MASYGKKSSIRRMNNMKFNNLPYKRPDMEKLKEQFNSLLDRFSNSASFEIQDSVMEEINKLRSEYDSMKILVFIRHTINTADEVYEKEQDFFDENDPIYQGLVAEYYTSIINSKFKDKLVEKWGKQLFTIAELKRKVFSPSVVEALQEENRLQSEYGKLLASAKIMFEGEERNLAGLGPFQQSLDRDMRKRAFEARFSFFEQNEEKLDSIYDSLVKLRTKIARSLGFPNFVPLAYARLMRSDYDSKMAANFRKQVKDYIVPAASRFMERLNKRLGIDSVKYYDETFRFAEGNPKPLGNIKFAIFKAGQMFNELSNETGEFFRYMDENELMDLENKKNKATGAYSDYMSFFNSPFIFSSFNNTYDDILTFCHEAGHAFQSYCSMDYKVPEYYSPTYDACEIHSMSMELLTWPWMKHFFGDDADRYKYLNLSDALTFIPYGVSVDEFQHYVYENPDITPAQRKNEWKQIETKYLPWKNYDGSKYLERGGFWQRQAHIYEAPFYYIDYTLAQVCAFQFWSKSSMDRKSAWEDYYRLCKAGGSKSFLQLVELAGLKSPFESGSIKSIIDEVESWLMKAEDSFK